MWLSQENLRAEKSEKNAKKREAADKFHEDDIVASFIHNRPKDIENLTFERKSRESRREAPILTIKGEINENVVEIGEEVNCIEDGFDFAVAVVDKKSGKVTYRPARLYSFESKYSQDIEKLIGAKKKNSSKPINFEADFGIQSEKWAEKRRQLTENFGSSKKLKMAEATQRRTIEQETLDEMRKTAFASDSNLKKEEDVKLSDISIIQKGVSSILPPAVQAELSKDIYPISLFLAQEEIDAVAEAAIEIMSKKKKEKIELGIPAPVLMIMYNETTETRAAAYLLLSTMVEIITHLGRSKSMLRKDFNSLKTPNLLRQKIEIEYLEASEKSRGFNGRSAERIKLNSNEYDRLVAYTLALALTLAPEHKVPISPFQEAFSYPLTKLEKIFQALGADIIRLDTVAAIQFKSLRGAQLLKPPSLDKNKTKKLRRR